MIAQAIGSLVKFRFGSGPEVHSSISELQPVVGTAGSHNIRELASIRSC